LTIYTLEEIEIAEKIVIWGEWVEILLIKDLASIMSEE
jgi:hypothetical protein